MLCGTGLGTDPARLRSPPHHGRSLNWANQDKPPIVLLPDVAARVGRQPPALPKARLRPGLPARRRRKGRRILGAETVPGRKSRQPLPKAWQPGSLSCCGRRR